MGTWGHGQRHKLPCGLSAMAATLVQMCQGWGVPLAAWGLPQMHVARQPPGSMCVTLRPHPVTYQGLKGRVLHEIIVQVAVGHHPVHLNAEGNRVGEEP